MGEKQQLQYLLRADVIEALTYEMKLTSHNYVFNTDEDYDDAFDNLILELDVDKFSRDYGLIFDDIKDVKLAIEGLTTDDIKWEKVF